MATFLHHYGAENVANLSTVRECGIARGTVYNYIDRVTQAIRELRDDYVKWPTGDRLAEVKKDFGAFGFKNCIGALDGTTMQLAVAPSKHRMSYRCRHKYWAVRIPSFLDCMAYPRAHAHADHNARCRVQ